jgi:hypothetical protein
MNTMKFSEWLIEREKRQDEGWGWLGALAKSGAEVAAQMAGLPTGNELGLNSKPVAQAAQAAWDAYGDHFKPLTQEQIDALKNACFNERKRSACDTLCSKTRNKKACAKVGYEKIGRRWVLVDPFKNRGV